jgi:hypothetical protein
MEVRMRQKTIASSVLFVFMVVSIVAAGAAKDESVASKWAATLPSIDGMNTEWSKVPMTTYKKAEIDYAFMNNEDNLFVLFIFRNPRYLSSLQWTGLTMWISPQGKKEKDLGIKLLRKQISADEYIAIMEEQVGQKMPEDRKAQIRQNKAYWMFEQRLINKKAEGYDKDAEPPKYSGAAFRNNMVDKAVIYEVAVSLPKLTEVAPSLTLGPGMGLNVNFEWGGATKEYKESLTRRLSQGETRAQDQKAGSLTGERGGGGLGDVEYDSVKMARFRRQLQQVKQYDFWVELNLAQNK